MHYSGRNRASWIGKLNEHWIPVGHGILPVYLLTVTWMEESIGKKVREGRTAEFILGERKIVRTEIYFQLKIPSWGPAVKYIRKFPPFALGTICTSVR